ncbi:beta-1,6-N-acetylglucosaminyltransferase [Croceicoccus sediminis]|uniref:beta-1,6-N-acetylglucosaminyltransferase n=1 Tax=Croceicoccus sediminis TaxID=2571150 RepID=UPI0011820ACA|nr:beta-1,6-N-acetylglucosaminyltransferase [Croceicoccus sediminis]
MSGPLAFLVLAHDDPAMLRRLCERLSPHPTYVHIDAKAQDMGADILADMPHVTVASHRHAIDWAGYAMVEATLDLLELARKDGLARHTLLISGHCYPIRPVADLAGMLAGMQGEDVIQMVRVGPDSVLRGLVGRHWRQRPFLSHRTRARHRFAARADDLARRIRNRIARSIGRRFEDEVAFDLYHGASWWALSAETVATVLDAHAADPQLGQALRTGFAPDELFFQTMIAAGPRAGHQHGPDEDKGGDNIYDAPLVLVRKGNARWMRDDAETRKAIASTDRFFARKIASRDAGLLDWIDRERLRIAA